MRKLLSAFAILIFISLFNSNSGHASTTIEQQSFKDALLTTLDPVIRQAVVAHYGYDKSYGLFDADILKIEREEVGEFTFIVDVQVQTFENAHNPPIGKETIQFRVSPQGVEQLSFAHEGDDEEKKMKQFYKDVLIDIKKTFHLNLLPYERYDYKQLRYKAEKQDAYNSLAAIAEEIVINILSPEIQPPFKNVIDPVTFVKDDEGFILFKKSDGSNVYYQVQRENGIWKVVEQESKAGKKMKYDLLWYM